MKKFAILLGGLALSALPCTSALADSFSFSGPTFSASGNFTYTTTGTAEQFLGTSVNGTAFVNGTGFNITGIAPLQTFLGNDNLYFTGNTAALLTSGRPFDFDGFAFLLSNGNAITLFSQFGNDVEILGVYATGLEITTENSLISVSTATIPVNPIGPIGVTPEPGSLALLGTGALGAFGILRRKLAA